MGSSSETKRKSAHIVSMGNFPSIFDFPTPGSNEPNEVMEVLEENGSNIDVVVAPYDLCEVSK